jgi:hypothetical protein
MMWARMLAYITGTVDQELLLRNEYLATENRILRAKIKGRLLLSDSEKTTLAKLLTGWGGKPWPKLQPLPSQIPCGPQKFDVPQIAGQPVARGQLGSAFPQHSGTYNAGS